MKTRITLLLPLFCTALAAQNTSGTILGTVRDAQDALIPKASVAVANVATGVVIGAATNSAGEYTVPFLIPGEYSVTAEAAGFKKITRTGVNLRVADRLVIDLRLEVGAVAEQVTINASTPLVEAASITLGQVVETRRILDLPLNGRDPYALAQLSPGVAPPETANATAQGGTIPNISGAATGTSSVSVDGANNVHPYASGYFLIYTPNVDSVAEFKVQTNSMSAEYGRSNGGEISIVTKSGTNQYHGTAYWFLRNSAMDANDFFSNRAGIPLASFKRHQAGGTVGGPLTIPHLYHGKDRTFFFLDYEGFRESVATPQSFTVPTALERNGDFSKTLNAAGRLVQMYDPLAATSGPSGTIRAPFSGNIIPSNRIDPVSRKMMGFYPLPNSNSLTANLVLNLPSVNSNDTMNVRIDQYAGRHRFLTRFSYQRPLLGIPNFYGNLGNPTNPPLEQRRKAATVQDVYTIGPTLIANLTYSLTRMYGHRTPWSEGFDITQLGFPASFAAGQQDHAIPITSLTNYSGIGILGNFSTQTAHTFQGTLTKMFSRHHVKVGGDYRIFLFNALNNTGGAGNMTFSSVYTQGPDANQASTTAGNAVATMLLGLPGGSIRIQPAAAFESAYQAAFVQDDWNVTSRLTVFLGMRWEVTQPRSERYDRMSILDLGQPSPIAVQVPSLGLKGAMTFPGGSNRRLADPAWHNFGPRGGLAYRIGNNTVVRAAYGLFYGVSSIDSTISTAFADGFSSTTNIVTSIDEVHPFQTLSNPFPNGILPPTTKSQLTPSLSIGTSSNSALLSIKTPYTQQWNVTLQRAVRRDLLAEVVYAANKGSRALLGNIQLDTLTADQLALGTYTQQVVANPFYGVITDPTSALSRTTISRRQLMYPYPQYTSVSSEAPSLASSIYHSMQAKVDKRFSNGFTLLASYTISKTLTNATGAAIANATNLRAERSLTTWDVPQRLALSGILELPVGRGKRFGSNWGRPADAFLGGWQCNGIATFQTGMPMALTSTGATRPDRIRPVQPSSGAIQSRLTQYFDTGAFAIPKSFTYGTAPATEPDVRAPGIDNFDLSMFKGFRLVESVRAQLRFESFNTFNRVQFGRPGGLQGSTSFGVITTQVNQPRKLQVALKVIF